MNRVRRCLFLKARGRLCWCCGLTMNRKKRSRAGGNVVNRAFNSLLRKRLENFFDLDLKRNPY